MCVFFAVSRFSTKCGSFREVSFEALKILCRKFKRIRNRTLKIRRLKRNINVKDESMGWYLRYLEFDKLEIFRFNEKMLSRITI